MTSRESGAGRALVVGPGDARSALAGVRALAAAGWTVGVAAPEGRGLAASSRLVRRRHAVPGPAQDAAAFTAGVAAAVAAEGYEVLLPAGDAELLALSAERERLGAVLPAAPHERLVAALDKLGLTRAAEAAGLGVPRTWTSDGPWPEDWDGEVVVKPRLHHRPGAGDDRARREVRIARSVDEARELAAAMTAGGGDALLQERVTGRLIAVSGVLEPGAGLRGAVVQVADATWPGDIGVTARGRTIAPPAGLVEGVERLLTGLDWVGLAQVQFIDGADRPPAVIDLNGRLYGSIGLAVRAGANLPAVAAALATGRTPPDATARPGVVYQWLESDLRSALAGDGPRMRALGGVLALAPRAAHTVWSPRDPGPALRYLAGLPRRVSDMRRNPSR